MNLIMEENMKNIIKNVRIEQEKENKRKKKDRREKEIDVDKYDNHQ